MGAPSQATQRDPVRTSWSRHLAGAALGVGFAMAVEAVTVLEQQLRGVSQREVAGWALWAIVGVLLLLGGVTVVAVLLSPRLPWLPTAAAVLLGYGILTSLPSGFVHLLPSPGPGLPKTNWGLSTITLVAGVMTAAAVWGWWSYRRRRVAA